MKKTFVKIKRYISYMLQYVFLEKLRGLDFTMRNIGLEETTKGRLSGYSKTNEKHLREIFDYLQITEEDKILDVGCGKGVVLKEAAKYPFSKIGGIDIQENIIMIAKRNMKRLGLQDKVSCECADALNYSKYGEYNIFFFFNPFCEEIFAKVIEKIKNENSSRRITIIYHNPVYGKICEKYFIEKHQFFDKAKQYKTSVYVFEK